MMFGFVLGLYTKYSYIIYVRPASVLKTIVSSLSKKYLVDLKSYNIDDE